VVAVDTNVLVYAHRREAAEHQAALDRLRHLASGPAAWAIPWPCVYEFLSVVTNPRIWKSKASTPDQAWAQVRAWAEAPTVRLLAEPDGFSAVLEPLVRRARVRGPMVHDARVAALCLAHGVEVLLTRDRDFSLFPELEIEDPFATGRR
jgi:toxin-antitoxin system PIN domain toxin